jgi:hypothetical protein
LLLEDLSINRYFNYIVIKTIKTDEALPPQALNALSPADWPTLPLPQWVKALGYLQVAVFWFLTFVASLRSTMLPIVKGNNRLNAEAFH